MWAHESIDENTYIVDGDTNDIEVRVLSTTEKQNLTSPPVSVRDVLVVASLLARVPRMPIDAISNVLWFAGVLVTVVAETTESVYGDSEMNHDYLHLKIPRFDLPLGVRILQFFDVVAECTSHDQGWASEGTQHNGTYNGSWTWADIVVVKDHGEDGEEEANRFTLCHNLRARRVFRHHVKRFDSGSQLTSSIVPGDTLKLVLRSRFPGWANTASFGRLQVRVVLDIDEDFDFSSSKELNEIVSMLENQRACCIQ
ncbi:hypothetical protein P43SY_004263 [Pythium insidiosum]|uniref:Uncharacterized protein n=1 Tax=Pythium insidiosum TaxID=114742 RepID=A0AAD5LBU9_PYTIN|nr:hypothetical protein P43SY_004263 [Pythium insidiosum]